MTESRLAEALSDLYWAHRSEAERLEELAAGSAGRKVTLTGTQANKLTALRQARSVLISAGLLLAAD